MSAAETTLAFSTAPLPPVHITLDGKSYALRRLTMGDMMTLSRKLHEVQANENAGRLKALLGAGVKQDQLPATIRELTRQPTYAEVHRWLWTTEGAAEAVALVGEPHGLTLDKVKAFQCFNQLPELAQSLSMSEGDS